MQHDAEKRETDANAEMGTNGVEHAATGVPGQHEAVQADDAVDNAGFITNGE